MKQLIDQAPVAIAVLDKTMCYVAASRRWLSDYGLTSQSIIGKSHYEVFPDLPEYWKDVHLRCLSGAVERSEEELFERADGSQQWLRWEIRPWLNDVQEIGGVIIFTEDITTRKNAERKLALSEERYRKS